MILGVVQGLTEFIPVSSTGHLILLGNILDFSKDYSKMFDVVVQLGSVFAVLLFYSKRFLGLFSLNMKTDSFKGVNAIIILILASLPAGLLGVLIHDFVKTHLHSSYVVALALIVGGIVMICIDQIKISEKVSSLDSITKPRSLAVGFFQALALCPGVSRSGSTIIGAIFLGFNKKVAAEFSFLMSVPILSAAALYDFYKSYDLISVDALPVLGVGIVSAFVTSILSIKLFLGLLNKFGFRVFGIYRVVLGVAVIIFSIF